MTTYTLTLKLRPGPPVIFNDSPLPPYTLKVGDTVVYQLDSESSGQGWTLQGLAFTASAWFTDGTPIVIGGAFQIVETAVAANQAHVYTLPMPPSVPGSERPAVTIQYTTGESGTGVGFTVTGTYRMGDVIISLGLTLTAKSPTGEIYSSHDPQVIVGPQH